jgi:hypothetical protein
LNVQGTETPSGAWNAPTCIVTTNQPTHNNFSNFPFLKLTSNLVTIKKGGAFDSSHPKYMAQDILGPVATTVKGRMCFIVIQNIWHRSYWILCLP